MTQLVNISYIPRLFDPLFVLDDEEIDALSEIDFDDEIQVKFMLKNYIAENFKKYGPISKEIVKNTIKYILLYKNNNYSFSNIFPEGEMPIKGPLNKTDFLIWLWDVLFPNQSLEEFDLIDFKIQNNYEAPNSVYIK